MVAVSATLISLNPSDSATGVPLNNAINVIFDREVDEWSIEHGGLILEGPDTDLVIYPGYIPTTLIQGEESEILQSAGLKGVVQGDFTFSRVSLTSTDAVNTSDTEGHGVLFRTKVSFQPHNQMAPLTEYRLYLVGDDDTTDTEIYGLRSRTVFDGEANSDNEGTGKITFSGTYLGEATSDTLNVRITSSGVAGVATFEAWRDSAPLDLVGPFLTSSTESHILDGITAQFTEGLYRTGDEFTVVVKRPDRFTGTVIATFTTGNGSITVAPTSTSTSIVGDLATSTSTAFEVVSTTPEDLATHLDPSVARRIVIEFSDDIDEETVTSDSVQVLIEPVTDHPALSPQVPTGPIAYTATVSGTKLFIDL